MNKFLVAKKKKRTRKRKNEELKSWKYFSWHL